MTTYGLFSQKSVPASESHVPLLDPGAGSQRADHLTRANNLALKQIADEAVQNAKIMAIDDDSVVLRALHKHLTEGGYQNVATTIDSETAFLQLREQRPDLVLLDIGMPLSGLQLLEMIRADDALQRVPVIVLTSSADSDTKLQALKLGANDFLTKPMDESELLTRVKNNLIVKMHFDQLALYSQQLEQEVFVDALADIANRRAFDNEVCRRLKEWTLRYKPLALLLVDIDHFKKVNDCHGHRAGDKLLRDLARTLEQLVGPDDFACRYGGEEFAILKSGASVLDAQMLAASIRTAVENMVFVYEELKINLTVSLGVTVAIERDSVDTLLQRADSALYMSKQSGRNCCHFHDGHTCQRMERDAGNTCDADSTKAHVARPACDHLMDAKIMIVDDDPVMVMVIKKYLKNGGYHDFVTSTDATTALKLVRSEQPDILLLDVCMPNIGGLEILGEIRTDEQLSHIPVIILTSSTDASTKSQALEAHANDFLAKPVDVSELLSRVRTNLLVKAQHDRLAKYSEHLEFEINCRTAELFAARNEAIHCLAAAAECRDDQTGHHTYRVGRYAAIIAQELRVPEDQLKCIESAAQLHDVGKIGIPDSILKKRGSLTQEERNWMQDHAQMGERILQECRSPIMRMAATIAVTHHEKWDGTGYPRGLSGTDIPLEGRITAVADVFDALSSKRHYKDALELDECFAVIKEGRGSHFDPEVTDAFLRCTAEVIDVYEQYGDPSEE